MAISFTDRQTTSTIDWTCCGDTLDLEQADGCDSNAAKYGNFPQYSRRFNDSNHCLQVTALTRAVNGEDSPDQKEAA